MVITTLAVLLPALQGGGVAVPPQPKFVVGSSVKRHVTLVAQMCDSNEKSTLQITMTISPQKIEKRDVHITSLTMDAEGMGKSNYLLKTSPNGVPIECKSVGQSEDGQGLNYLLFFMRQPLWPAAKEASTWAVSLPNPLLGKPKQMKVSCKAERAPNDTGRLRLEERTDVMSLENGATLQVTSILEVEAATGKVWSIHEEADMFADGKKSQIVTFDERG